MRKRVCIVSPLDSDGFYSVVWQSFDLAASHESAGDSVTVVLLDLGGSETSRALAHWRWQAHQFEIVSLALNERGVGPLNVRAAFSFYDWLKSQKDFDRVLYPERGGIAYFAIAAKRTGLRFAHSSFCVWLQEPTLFSPERKEELPCGSDLFIADDMEQKVTLSADHVVATSNSLVRWLQERGWNVPSNLTIRPSNLSLLPKSNHRAAMTTKTVVVLNEGSVVSDALRLFLSSLAFLPEELKSRVRFQIVFAPCDEITSTIRDAILTKMGSWRSGEPVVAYREPVLKSETVLPDLAVVVPRCANQPLIARCWISNEVPIITTPETGLAEYDNVTVLQDRRPAILAEALQNHPALAQLPPTLVRAKKTLQELSAAAFSECRASNGHTNKHERGRCSPLVTVCITHFERPDLLEEAILSVQKQTYPLVEVVVVDDGSPSKATRDRLHQLEAKYKRSKVSFIFSENNYPGHARNTAAAAAHGEYLVFLDDDNVAKPEMVEVLVNAALHSGGDIVICFFEFSSCENQLCRPGVIQLFLGGAIRAGLFINTYGDTNTALIRRSAFVNIKYREDFIAGHADWEFYARAALLGAHFEILPEPLVFYRQTKESLLRGSLRQSLAANFMLSASPYFGEHPIQRCAVEFSLGMEHVFKVKYSDELRVARSEISALRNYLHAAPFWSQQMGEIIPIKLCQSLAIAVQVEDFGAGGVARIRLAANPGQDVRRIFVHFIPEMPSPFCKFFIGDHEVREPATAQTSCFISAEQIVMLRTSSYTIRVGAERIDGTHVWGA